MFSKTATGLRQVCYSFSQVAVVGLPFRLIRHILVATVINAEVIARKVAYGVCERGDIWGVFWCWAEWVRQCSV